MTQHTYCGVTFSLITGDELSARLEEIVDRWGPDWRDDPVKRLVMDTLSECEHFIDHYEDAARLRATRNQCDGCARGLRINQSGNHIDADGRPVIGCTAHLYAGHAKALHKLAASLICPPAADDREDERLRKMGAL